MPMRFVVWLGALCGGGVSSRSPPWFTGQPLSIKRLAFTASQWSWVPLAASCCGQPVARVDYRPLGSHRISTQVEG